MSEEESKSKETTKEIVEEKGGFLEASLGRTTRQIREDRGEDISKGLQIAYKQYIEMLEYDIDRFFTTQNRAFDFSPNSTTSLVIKDVDAKTIMEQDLVTSIKIRQTRIELNIAKQRYNFLFGPTYELETII